MDRNESQGMGKGGKGATGGGEQQKDVREGFGDDMGTRVGRPDPAGPGALDDRSMARLSEKDLKLLTTDRNVPDALRTQARRKISSGDK